MVHETEVGGGVIDGKYSTTNGLDALGTYGIGKAFDAWHNKHASMQLKLFLPCSRYFLSYDVYL